MQVVANQLGQEIALVTRNGYGVLVLNTAKAMFVDIDFSKSDMKTTPATLLKGWLGNPMPDPEERYSQSVLEWGKIIPNLGFGYIAPSQGCGA